jgi:hypothetical protein
MAEKECPDNYVECANFMAAQIAKAFPGALIKQLDKGRNRCISDVNSGGRGGRSGGRGGGRFSGRKLRGKLVNSSAPGRI